MDATFNSKQKLLPKKSTLTNLNQFQSQVTDYRSFKQLPGDTQYISMHDRSANQIVEESKVHHTGPSFISRHGITQGKVSVLSDQFRQSAVQIMETYNKRLEKVGKNEFQIRLNLFFTFVRQTSMEAEAYDVLQSVAGSVMNHSDKNSITIR